MNRNTKILPVNSKHSVVFISRPLKNQTVLHLILTIQMNPCTRYVDMQSAEFYLRFHSEFNFKNKSNPLPHVIFLTGGTETVFTFVTNFRTGM